MARMASEGDEYEEEEEKWSQWFCGLPGNEYFCEINLAYIEDSFNLYGLRAMVSNYQDALNIILDLTDIPYDDDVPSCAAELYGLIHARYIITSHGLDAMLKKFRDGDFGFCPRALCDGQPVVPAGMYDEPKKAEMKQLGAAAVDAPIRTSRVWVQDSQEGAEPTPAGDHGRESARKRRPGGGDVQPDKDDGAAIQANSDQASRSKKRVKHET
ncbi:hypothetical protein DYB25_005821 [Aphanomyces astaci]|uniref:Casein kinase II subunit beta n=1 Tax=Aphanomyces astaci TaxID=112090 RepID=A0A397A940_APHAT|nr:hypothetical protein DYB25_005821 [Aphanomyces astaci]RHY54260.1 hypothetical protein DYB34_002443 [Aphanomyces astaci]RHY63125.1 hypothetical protein DYB30_002125 [Aphanomyces astaci]RHY64708.1 hypothetical protein DYB38_001921 [Aphanomyces astaci]RHZ15420.1 hypothetical protein DYB31_000510 [Aphanomyces astaci]